MKMRLRVFPTVLALAAVSIVSSRLLAGQPPHAPDGGTIERIQSLFIPPMPNAPFTATVVTDWTKYLQDGATQVIKNHRTIARDARGRVFQERRYFTPDGDVQTTRLTQTEIRDPQQHVISVCDVARKVCELRAFAAAMTLPPSPPAYRNAKVTSESLGTQTIDGIETVGSRETQTVTLIGVDRPIAVTKEFWYSARLGINLVTKRVDPRGGAEEFTVTHIDPSEPDASLFELPKDARVVDLRGTGGR
jgi:hypothetical protein